MDKEKNRLLLKPEIIATICIIVVIFFLTSILFSTIYSMEEKKCWNTLEENANEISVNIAARIHEDRQLITVIADVIASFDSMDSEEVRSFIDSFTPSTISSYIAVLLPDDRVVLPDKTIENSGMSFSEIAALGMHISDRETSIEDDNLFVIYNFMPIIQNHETVAMLFGVINLETLPSNLTFSNYDGNGSVFLFDGNTGNDLINTWHGALGNAYDRGPRPVKKGYDYEEMQKESFAGATGHIVFTSKSIGEYLYYYYRPVDINNWTMALSVQESVVFAEALTVKKVLIVFVVIETLAFLCYLSWMLWHVKSTTQKEREQNVILEEALERAESAGRAKSTFLSNMSHDIRTPMNAIIGFTTIAASHIDEKERVQDCLNKITSSSNHLLALINDVLDMSKIESGTIRLQEHECNLSEIMNNLTDIVQSQISAKELKLSVECLDVVHKNVYMDSLRFNQMLLNITGNAIKYTKPGGSINIKISEKPSELELYGNYVITIKDTGIGMSEEYLPHIFETFTRERNSTISKIEGTGLGLSITKHIVDIMGGTIDVDSELGKGTEFTITFSLKLQEIKDGQDEAPTKQLPIAAICFSDKRILLAEDNELNREIAVEILSGVDFIIETAENGQIAVDMIKASQPGFYDAVLMDVQMPVMNGYEATQEIRRLDNEELASIPIVAMTANAFEEDKQEALDNGMDAHIAKPIDLETIVATLLGVFSE